MWSCTLPRVVFMVLLCLAIPSTAGARSVSKTKKNSAFFTLQLNGKKRSIPLVTIRGKRYCSLSVLDASAAKKTSGIATWKAGDWQISAAGSGFFIRVQNADTMFVAQMQLPAIKQTATVLVPYPQFFQTLSAAGCVSFRSAESSVRILQRPLLAASAASAARSLPVSTPAPKLKIPVLRSSGDTAVSGEREKEISKEIRKEVSKEVSKEQLQKQPLHSEPPRSEPLRNNLEAPVAPDPHAADTALQSMPIRQSFPKGLKRRELEDSSQSSVFPIYDSAPEEYYRSSGVDSYRNSRPSSVGSNPEWPRPLFASLIPDLRRAVPRIRSVRVRASGRSIVFSFRADETLLHPPRASITNRQLRISFPSAINTARYPSSFASARVTRFRSFLDNSAQVFSCVLPVYGMNAEVRAARGNLYTVVCSPASSTATSTVNSTKKSEHDVIESETPKAASSLASESASDSDRRKWRFDCVVIDAGHGGKDDGAHSVHGYKEKDATLAIAQKLRSELRRAMPGLRVVMTRSTDVFIPLHQRGSIANKADGKLFISIHCNSVPQKPSRARGCETYILSPAKTSAAIDVASRENAVVQLEDERDRYAGMTGDQQVLVTLAQTSFVKFSSGFARRVQKNVVPLTGMPDRGVSQAGFLVLVCASMPAVLVETGFVSHPQDERLLFRPDGQKKIARGIATAVREYAAEYSKLLRH
ncbi:MAG: N-acetylmuramoyl-L-alanine amidase [Candidatus Kapaibacterium sp.]